MTMPIMYYNKRQWNEARCLQESSSNAVFAVSVNEACHSLRRLSIVAMVDVDVVMQTTAFAASLRC